MAPRRSVTSCWLRAPRAARPHPAPARGCGCRARPAMSVTRRASPGWSASHSGVKRVSSSVAPTAARCLRVEAGELVQRVRGATSPPGEVQARPSRSTRSGWVHASSWATIPPKLTPTTRQVSHPRWSSSAAASAAYSAMVYGPGGIDVRPIPRWSCAATSKRSVNTLTSNALALEGGAGAVEEQQAPAAPAALVVEVEVGEFDGGHGHDARCCPTWPAPWMMWPRRGRRGKVCGWPGRCSSSS